MDIIKSLEYLRDYVEKNIDTTQKGQQSDYGIRALMTKVEYDYKYNLGLNPNNEPVNDLIEATWISMSNSPEFIEALADRDYVSDVFLKKNIDVERYVKAINHYRQKLKREGQMTFDDGYEATHWIWALYVICRDNRIIHTYQDLMADTLIELYHNFPPSDLRTECLCFLTMIDVSKVKEQWIIDLEKTQKNNGTLKTETPEREDLPQEDKEMYVIHHLCLGLIAIYNYYNVIRIK